MNKRNLKILAIIIAIILIVVLVILLTPTAGILSTFLNNENHNENNTQQPTITNSYSNITSEALYQKINNSEDTTILDLRPCPCSYKSSHIPTAELPPDNIEELYNNTNTIIIYDWDATPTADAIDYCQRLINNTYATIYYLDGGVNEWINQGYSLEPGEGN